MAAKAWLACNCVLKKLDSSTCDGGDTSKNDFEQPAAITSNTDNKALMDILLNDFMNNSFEVNNYNLALIPKRNVLDWGYTPRSIPSDNGLVAPISGSKPL